MQFAMEDACDGMRLRKRRAQRSSNHHYSMTSTPKFTHNFHTVVYEIFCVPLHLPPGSACRPNCQKSCSRWRRDLLLLQRRRRRSPRAKKSRLRRRSPRQQRLRKWGRGHGLQRASGAALPSLAKVGRIGPAEQAGVLNCKPALVTDEASSLVVLGGVLGCLGK